MIQSAEYKELIQSIKNINHLKDIMLLLDWDEQVNLPKKAEGQRAEQASLLAERIHHMEVDPRRGELLYRLEKTDDLPFDAQVVVRETRREYDRLNKLPPKFIKRKTHAKSIAYHAWVKALKKNDFATFLPHLEKQIDLALEESAFQGFAKNPYDYWIDQNDPGLTASALDDLFQVLKKDLIPIVRAIAESKVKPNKSILKGFPLPEQKVFAKEVSAKLGFDYDAGRLDTAIHPFCSSGQLDCRITTRFCTDDPLDSLFSTLHEAGHGLYEQGLSLETIGTPLSKAVGMGLHESQSRLWENQVSRSPAFWKFWEGRYRELFPEQLKFVSSEDLFLAINAVKPSLIRVDADEVTYNLHVMLRFELEQKLFSKELEAKDLPHVWSDLSQELLGLRPFSDTDGVLQDVHWSCGLFGYFPSYALGNIIGAQIWYAAQEHIQDLDKTIEKGDFKPLLEWLRKQVYSQGKRYMTTELVERVTGSKISPKPLIRYLKERYLPLYKVNSSKPVA